MTFTTKAQRDHDESRREYRISCHFVLPCARFVSLWCSCKSFPTLSPVRIVLGLAFPFVPVEWRVWVVVVAAITDMFDGLVARWLHAESDTGRLLDPVADKVFLLMLLGTLLAEGALHPLWFLGLALRDIVVLIGLIDTIARRQWAKGRMMRPSLLGKCTTAMQLAVLFVLVGWHECRCGSWRQRSSSARPRRSIMHAGPRSPPRMGSPIRGEASALPVTILTMIRLTREPIDYHALTESVREPHCGAVALFLGTVRDLTGELRYRLPRLRGLWPDGGEEARGDRGRGAASAGRSANLAMVHRLGRLEVGEVSVAVAVSCPHRGEAFDACRFAVDTLKELVPIWKKENAPDGAGNGCINPRSRGEHEQRPHHLSCPPRRDRMVAKWPPHRPHRPSPYRERRGRWPQARPAPRGDPLLRVSSPARSSVPAAPRSWRGSRRKSSPT